MKYVTPTKIFVGGGLLVVAMWLAVLTLPLCITTDQLEALFTGLGFVGVIAAFVHERSMGEAADAEHANLIQEMRNQSRATHEATFFNAVNAKISAYTQQMEEAMQSRNFELHGQLKLERAKWLRAQDHALGQAAKPFTGENWMR